MIRVQNIYYMLAYAFQTLKEGRYVECGTEEFVNTGDLLSAILIKGVTWQIRYGLVSTYINQTEVLDSVHGKINIADSIKLKMNVNRPRLVCTFDEFSMNTSMNQIIKSTITLLLRNDIPLTRKRELRKLLPYFREVDTVNLHSIRWNFQFNQNNYHYQMLISVCYLIVKGLLQTTTNGSIKLMQFLDEQRMCRLFEKFILAYYQKHYPQLNAKSSLISWALDDDISTLLPVMRSDIMLSYGNKTLIIDAKYYSNTTQNHYNKPTIHSNNLYQIFTYVKNKAAAGGDVSGMLLYAKTDDTLQVDIDYSMSGNHISVRTLDLDRDFEEISSQLNSIAEAFMM